MAWSDPGVPRDATSSEVKELRAENGRLKELVGEQALQVQLNPTFRPGKTIEELTAEGLLHPVCSEIFRRDKTAASTRLQKLG